MLHAKSPTFWAAKLKGFTVVHFVTSEGKIFGLQCRTSERHLHIWFIQNTAFSAFFLYSVMHGLFSSSKLHKPNTGFRFLVHSDVQVLCSDVQNTLQVLTYTALWSVENPLCPV